MDFLITVANSSHLMFADAICHCYKESAKERGTGIAERQPKYIKLKIKEGKGVIATTNGALAGFIYIETWTHGAYVAHSGLIVLPQFRKTGLAKALKEKVFDLTRTRYPEAKIFGITTSLAVMKLNTDLGYRPVTFSELTQDQAFWDGCKTCKNYDILQSNAQKMCLCTSLMFNPKHIAISDKKNNIQTFDFIKKQKVIERLFRIKKALFIKPKNKL